ncbi:MAG: competence/damage-inducible protein A [Bryobacteraceae bacterium]
MPDAEIIAVGSELLTPEKIDTNSLWLTDQLNTLGVEVVRKSIVGDERALLTATIRTAIERSAIVILTGGLGPTEDDVTRDAAAAALGVQQFFSQEICEGIEERFRSFGRTMAEINKRQAYLLEGARILNNPRGTAPGQWIEAGSCIVLLLPGPPGELKPMFTRECKPRLEERLPKQVIRTRFYRVSGIGESDLDALIAPIYTKYTNPATTILASPGDVHIHLRARAETPEQAETLLQEVGPPIEALLGDRIYSFDGDSLEKVVGDTLRTMGETLSVAESCTGGMLGGRITSVPGSSDYFLGGFQTYTEAMKIKLLGVSPELLAEFTAVSEECARAMAEGAREKTGSTWALSVTGYAGPGAGVSDATPVGTVFIGCAGRGFFEARRVRFPGDRDRIRGLAVIAALDLLRRSLAKSPGA